MDQQTSISNPVAPEDLAAGCYVAMLFVIGQHMPFFCGDEFLAQRTEPAKMRWLPSTDNPRLSDSYGRRAFRAFKAAEKAKDRKEKGKDDAKASSSSERKDDKSD